MFPIYFPLIFLFFDKMVKRPKPTADKSIFGDQNPNPISIMALGLNYFS
jgi:hypothetical protein